MTRGKMIQARGLAQTFHTGQGRKKTPVHAVDGVDLDVAEGEVVGFLGPNGAGKTTTLRMLVTLLRPDGRARPPWPATTWSASPVQVRRSIGYCSQVGGDLLRCLRRGRGRRPRDALRDVPQGRRGQGAGAVRAAPARRAVAADAEEHVRRPEAAARHRDGPDPRRRPWSSSTSRPPASTRRPGPTCGSTSPDLRSEQRGDGLPDHALPRRGRRPQRPDRDHRPGRDRRQRHRRQPQGQRVR